MAINKESNGFTFGFSIGMVVVVGAILTFLFLTWKPLFDKNDADKKMMDVLAAIKVDSERINAKEMFDQYVKKRVSLSFEGSVMEEREGEILSSDKADPFNIDVKKDYKRGTSKLVLQFKGDKPKLMEEVSKIDQSYPLYICEKNDSTFYVMPMVGTGLWGPIWGYVSLNQDMVTVYGASFDHKTETPGLGAEIKEPMFEDPFSGKKIYDLDGNYTSISVEKGGIDPDKADHEVDGITGGTITSNGVDEMLYRTMKIYTNYFESIK